MKESQKYLLFLCKYQNRFERYRLWRVFISFFLLFSIWLSCIKKTLKRIQLEVFNRFSSYFKLDPEKSFATKKIRSIVSVQSTWGWYVADKRKWWKTFWPHKSYFIINSVKVKRFILIMLRDNWINRQRSLYYSVIICNRYLFIQKNSKICFFHPIIFIIFIIFFDLSNF